MDVIARLTINGKPTRFARRLKPGAERNCKPQIWDSGIMEGRSFTVTEDGADVRIRPGYVGIGLYDPLTYPTTAPERFDEYNLSKGGDRIGISYQARK